MKPKNILTFIFLRNLALLVGLYLSVLHVINIKPSFYLFASFLPIAIIISIWAVKRCDKKSKCNSDVPHMILNTLFFILFSFFISK